MSSKMDFEQLVNLFRETHEAMQGQAIRAVDAAPVVRNWLFGWYTVEYEQQGEDRAAYGTALLNRLSKVLGKGLSTRSFRQFRAFYLHRKGILQTVSAELSKAVSLG